MSPTSKLSSSKSSGSSSMWSLSHLKYLKVPNRIDKVNVNAQTGNDIIYLFGTLMVRAPKMS